MGRSETDFVDYVSARWSVLFRTAYVLRGESQGAHDLTRTTLATTYARWRRLAEGDDVDHEVRRVLLSTHASWRERRSWARPAVMAARTGDATVPAATPGQVLAVLMQLPPGQRAVLALRCLHGLRPQEIAELLSWSPSAVTAQAELAVRTLDGRLQPVVPPSAGDVVPPRLALDDAVQAAVSDVAVPALRLEQVIGALRARRRRGRLTMVAALATAAVGAALIGVTGREPPAEPTSATPTAAWEELGVPWIAAGRLRYGLTSLPRPRRLTSVAATADSVVMTVGSDPAVVVELRPDGTMALVGQRVLGIALGDTGGHLAAWAQRVDADTTRLVAYDTAERRRIAAIRVPAGMQIHALAGRRLVLHDGRNGYQWSAGSAGEPVLFEPGHDTELVTDRTDSLAFVSEAGLGGRLLSTDGVEIASFYSDRRSAGSFDPSGSFVAGIRPYESPASMEIFDVERGELVRLEVPGSVDWTRWTPDGRLVVRTSMPGQRHADTPVQYFVCEPSDGSCLPLPADGVTRGEADGVEVGMLGQLRATAASTAPVHADDYPTLYDSRPPRWVPGERPARQFTETCCASR